jgi:hypothetical protein
MQLTVTPGDESTRLCACCGAESRTFWGEVWAPEGVGAVYYVHYALGSAEPPPAIDLIVGPWGWDTPPAQRVLVAMRYRPGAGGGIMVVDATGRPPDSPEMCGRALARADVVGTPFAQDVFALVDAVFLHDPRMQDVIHLGDGVVTLH